MSTRACHGDMTRQSTMLKKELTKIYALYDHELQTWMTSYEGSISCQKGCCTCCDMSIGLYLPEALVLADLLTETQYTRVVEHATRVFQYACDTSDYLTGFRYSAIGFCPFLDHGSGLCSIYEHRPANCRHVFSNMPPEYCAKDIMITFDQDHQKRSEFLRQLDPHVNEDDLPFIAPLQDIFHEKYEIYLAILTAKYFNFSMYGEMSWFITLAREHHLWNMVTGTETNLAHFTEKLQKTGLYHEHMLTDCQKILPHCKEQSVGINFTHLP